MGLRGTQGRLELQCAQTNEDSRDSFSQEQHDLPHYLKILWLLRRNEVSGAEGCVEATHTAVAH